MSRVSICNSSDLHIDISRDVDDQVDQVEDSVI